MRFFIIDAFTENIFGGNPAGVVLIGSDSDFPAESVMLKTAAELRYSETAFLKPIHNGGAHIRYFTPTAEVDFCGHATIAAFTALLKIGAVERNFAYPINTLSGDLTIDITEDSIMMEMPPSKLIKRITDPTEIDELYKSLGIKYDPVSVVVDGGDTVTLLPILIDTGFPDIFLPVINRETLAAIAPDFKYLASLSEKQGSGGVHAFTLEAPEGYTASCRNFAPLYGIDEEAATGTANGGLSYYLHIHGLAPSGCDCRFLQGEAMNRPSIIVSSVDVDSETTLIRIGGKGVVLAEGEISI